MDKCILYCNNCNKKFESKNCSVQLKQHLRWCNKKEDFLKKYNLNKTLLQEEYDNCGSILSFKDKYPYWDNFVHYYRLFKEFEINISLKISQNNIKTKEKRETTFLQKFGYKHNFCKNTKSRKKWENRLLVEEGITNVFQRDSVKEKITKTILEKYGKEFWKHSLTIRGNSIISKLNKKIFKILSKENLDFIIEFKIPKNTKGYYSYDILLENTNKIIEINGDYWHGNPNIYKENDIILKGSSGEILIKDKWEKDKLKINHAKENGYNVLIIWEEEMKNDIEKVREKIIEYARS